MKMHQPPKGMTQYKPKKARVVSLNSAAWKRLRAQVLAEEPLCRWCLALGKYVASTDVDHIRDSREDYSDDNSRENLTALCHECHSLKTARSMGKRVTLGCDVNGLPLDPDHPWNREKSPGTAGDKTAPDLLS
ncbi:HNH endonuclease signature motif containing protein [Pseudomonas luteola]|uniref:HNH endonuclease n=1 Tax=Pseudomonas luteola TaxID=47886 RepID=UPI003A8550B4